MYKFVGIILTLVSLNHADVSHLGTNLQANGYHFEQPLYTFPSEKEIVPQQIFAARNDFNPPAFLAQEHEQPAQAISEQPAPQTLGYIPPFGLPVDTNIKEDGYHYKQPTIPFISENEIVPHPIFTSRNDFNPPAFLVQKPQEPAPQIVPEQPITQTLEYITPFASPSYTNLQEDGYHYEQPIIPFSPVNEIVPQQILTSRNDFNPPAFLAEKPEEPAPEVVREQPTEYIPPQVTNLQEDGYHYEQPSIPFVPLQEILARNDFNPPAFLLDTEPAPQEPIYEEPTAAPQEPMYEELTSQKPILEDPVSALVASNIQNNGYHYKQPTIPFIQPEPQQQYLPVAQLELVLEQPKPEISTYFDSVQPKPEPSYSLGPNGYNYKVPSRPFRF